MPEIVPVDVIIYFPDRSIRIKSVLESLNLNAISYGGMRAPTDRSYPMPIGASYTLSARVSDWKEGKDGRPSQSEPTATPVVASKSKLSRERRAARRERERGRRRAAAQIHRDRSARRDGADR